jgi:2-desacetyl-2-hydroxyethyl bacteriochlorophyllide A dehydrogenase
VKSKNTSFLQKKNMPFFERTSSLPVASYAHMKTSPAIVIEKPRKAAYREVKLMPMTEDSILLRTTWSAISSGTDMKTWKGQQHPDQCWYPLVPGYENIGVVESVGKNAHTPLRVGDRVMINECRLFGDVCAAWGGNSRYVIKNSVTAPAPFDYAVKIPDNVSDQAAVLAYLAAVSLKGVSRLDLKDNETILIIGAGAIGLSAAQIIRILNPTCRLIVMDRSAYRCALAKSCATDVLLADVHAPQNFREMTFGKLADKVVECSGNSAVVGTLHQYLKDGGWTSDEPPGHIHLQGDYPETIVLDSWHRWFVKNAKVTMSCAIAAGGKEQILAWMSEGKFKTDVIPFETWRTEDCQQAFEHKESKGDDVFKILFQWS